MLQRRRKSLYVLYHQTPTMQKLACGNCTSAGTLTHKLLSLGRSEHLGLAGQVGGQGGHRGHLVHNSELGAGMKVE